MDASATYIYPVVRLSAKLIIELVSDFLFFPSDGSFAPMNIKSLLLKSTSSGS